MTILIQKFNKSDFDINNIEFIISLSRYKIMNFNKFENKKDNHIKIYKILQDN